MKQATQKVTLFFIAQLRYLVMQNEIPTELLDAILIAAGQAWVTGRDQRRTCEGAVSYSRRL
jgi:hypothetical protein